MNLQKLTPQEQVEYLLQGTEECISREELLEKLKKGKRLKIKFGADPTAPDLHLGHYVAIKVMKKFQELGHEVIFLIGDFTSMIGDPSGRSETRKPLTAEAIAINSETYKKQIGKVLDIDKATIAYNNDWFKKFSPADFIRLSSQYTVARMLERNDFHDRFHQGQPIAIHEFLYPLVQGYDSVELKADVELGGRDQKFNLIVGRELQKGAGQAPQVIITSPLLEGLDGVRKMSKSYGNYIGFTENPNEIFGKVMSISDEMMFRYGSVVFDWSASDITSKKQQHPRDTKVALAAAVVDLFHGSGAGAKAIAHFESVFKKGEIPADTSSRNETWSEIADLPAQKLLVRWEMATTGGEARRLIEGKALEIDGTVIQDPFWKWPETLASGKEIIVRCGKRKFLKVSCRS